jgi:hypothetical protein
MMSNQIPGVPEGWELVHVHRHAIAGEFYIGSDGVVRRCLSEKESMLAYPIIRKIEKPARYRPFANAQEFKPHRDRWVRQKESGSIFRGITYDEDGLFALLEIAVDPFCWEEAFEDFVFDDDGTPFGVKIDE